MWLLSILLFGLSVLHGNRCYVIEGSLTVPSEAPSNWFVNTRINVDGSQYVGFVKPDGSFEVVNVPSGSYMVEAVNTIFNFQLKDILKVGHLVKPKEGLHLVSDSKHAYQFLSLSLYPFFKLQHVLYVRVDISSKGRIRARRVNAPQPNAVKEVSYPLRLSALGKAVYFKTREQLRTTDLLFNPNVLYILVPFLLIMLLTKLINPNDPEFHKEMEQINILSNQKQLPDISEILSSMSFFGNSDGSNCGKKQIGSNSKQRKSVEKNRQTYSAINTGVEVGHNPASTSSQNSQMTSTPPPTGRKSLKLKNQKYD